MLVHCRVTPSIKFASTHFYTWVACIAGVLCRRTKGREPLPFLCLLRRLHLGEERCRKSKVSCPRTQHNVSSQGSNPDHSVGRHSGELTMRPPCLNCIFFLTLKFNGLKQLIPNTKHIYLCKLYCENCM